MTGFWISKITAKGENKIPAEIHLKRGANIITGPSDTGKSYLFSVINYVLGRSTNPDTDIPEGRGYDTFSLDLVPFKNDIVYSLERKLGKNEVNVSQSTNSIEEYRTNTPLSSENNISNFLLNLCDLKGSKLLKNRTRGDKQLLSFKNINQFTSIAEDKIITKASPFYFTQNNSNHILEQSMISLILEEMDFSDVKTIIDPKKKEIKISGQLEFIDKQIVNYSDKIQLISKTINSNYNNEIDKAFLDQKLESQINDAKNLELKISEYYSETNVLIEKRIYNQELIKRFKILERQYLSDLERLDFIMEAESLSSQLPSSLCPICSKPFSDDEINHLTEIENFKDGVIAEITKTKTKLEDLRLSINESDNNITKLNELSKVNKEKLNQLEGSLNRLIPEIKDARDTLNKFIESEKSNNQLNFFYSEIQNLYKEKDTLEKLKLDKDSTDIHNVCDYDILKRLTKYIQIRLESWKYNEDPKVVFNSDFKVFDIVISNKSRGSYGKGRRAISYAASLLGFLDFCLAENKNFSNLIMIDSPLTTFKDKDNIEEEEEYESIDNYFFENLADANMNSQIIIFENKVPNKYDRLNVIEFTRRKDYGRYGFYPLNT